MQHILLPKTKMNRNCVCCSCSLVPPFAPRDALHSWQEKNRRWLELTDVHRETTSNIRITVMPFYMGTKVQKKLVIVCKAGLIVCEIIINNNYWNCHLAPQNVVGRENEQRNICCFKQVDETKSTTVCSLLFFFFSVFRILCHHKTIGWALAFRKSK